MSTTIQVIAGIGVQIGVVTAIWFFGLALLRRSNFEKDGQRKTPLGAKDDDEALKRLEYHNKACYGAFEFFLKIALAVLAGIAYVAMQPSPRVETAKALMKSGAWLLVLAAGVFSMLIFIHQKSKIQRWPRRFTLLASLLWVEYWLIQGMLLVAVGMLEWVLPHLTAGGGG
jgi:hypothetical protein